MVELVKFKTYKKYRQSKFIWIKEIPSHWNIKKVAHTTYVKGRIGWQNLRSEEFSDTGYLCITGTDFDNGSIDYSKAYRVSKERYEQDKNIQLKENDLLITKDGTIGKIAIVSNLKENATLNSGIFVTRPYKHTYLQIFFYYVLLSDMFYSFIQYQCAGTTINHLYQNIFEKFRFPLPPISEQYQIASFLDYKVSKIDQLIQEKQELIELLKKKKTTLITKCVTKGLNDNVEMKDSGVEWIGAIPFDWKLSKIKRDYEVCLGKMVQPEPLTSTDTCEYYLRAANVQDNYIDISDLKKMWFSKSEREKFQLKKDDLIVCEGGEVGRAAIWKGEIERCFIQNAVHRVRGKKGKLNKFLYYWLYFLKNIGYIDLICNKATISHLTEEKLKKMPLLIIDIEEQQKIVDHLDYKTSKIDQSIQEIQDSIDYLKRYRTSLITAAVTGKIDVRDWEQGEILNKEAAHA